MDFLKVRSSSLHYLQGSKPECIKIVDDLFDVTDRCIEVYEKFCFENQYARVCGLTALKGKNLAVGIYGLILDGLGFESGALTRPFIECTELLRYFTEFPDEVELAEKNELPRAGDRASRIQGKYQEHRRFLNENSSHVSFNNFSVGYLLQDKMGFRKDIGLHTKSLERNFVDFSCHMLDFVSGVLFGLEKFSVDDMRIIEGDFMEINNKLYGVLVSERRDSL